MMRIGGVLAIALLVAACGSKAAAPSKDRSASIPESLYQPTVHAILAIGGAYGPEGSAQGIDTVWRRAGADQQVRLALSPQAVTVHTMRSGRYILDSIVVDGRELLLRKDDGSAASPVSSILLDPGDVIYVGEMLITDRAGENPDDNDGSVKHLVLRIRSDAARARRAVAEKHGQRSALMLTRPLRRRQ